jgi:hypothetical protein
VFVTGTPCVFYEVGAMFANITYLFTYLLTYLLTLLTYLLYLLTYFTYFTYFTYLLTYLLTYFYFDNFGYPLGKTGDIITYLLH